MPASTLDHWIKQGLCEPSLVGPSGKRATRYWSIRDVVTVRAVQALRGVGCPLEVARKARTILRDEWKTDLGDSVLWWDGHDVVTLTPAGDAVSLVTRHGQSILRQTLVHEISCPVSAWATAFSVEATPVDIVEIQQRRSVRRLA